MIRRRRWIARTVVVVAVFLAACNGDGKPSPPTTTRPTTTTTSTAPSTTSTTGGEPVPDPATTGEDFDRIFREIIAFEQYVAEHPDVDLLGVIYESGANVYPKVKTFITNLEAKGYRYDDDGPVVMEVTVQERSDPLNALLRVVTRHGPQKVVDGRGIVVEEGPGWEPRREQYLLKRGQDGRWRIQAYYNNGPA